MSHLKKYFDDVISREKEEDHLYQRRRALARLACNPGMRGVSKEVMHRTTNQVPRDCYSLTEARFCRMLLSSDIYDRLSTYEDAADRVRIINETVAFELRAQREKDAVQLYVKVAPSLKVRAGNDSRIALAMMNLAECRAYDAEESISVDVVGSLTQLMSATYCLRENGNMPTTQPSYDNLARLWFYLGMWHRKEVTEVMMTRAITELEVCLGIDWMATPVDFGPTNDVGSELWGDEGTPEYWDGDKYMTPDAAISAGAMIHSQAQDANGFSRDAMCDALAIASHFNINLATAVR